MDVGGSEELPLSDCDSDRTVVEGSVIESDSEEDELHLRRLIFINQGEYRNTAVIGKGIHGELPSPEFQLICKMNKQWKDSQNKHNFLNQELHDMSESPERSLLSGAIITVSKTTTENHGQMRISEEAPVKNMSADVKSNPQTPVTPRLKVRTIADRVHDTDTTSMSSNLILTKTPPQKRTAEDGVMHISDLLKPLNDSESPRMTLSHKDVIVFQDSITSLDKSVVESSNMLPTKLLPAPYASSESTPELVLQMETNGPENRTVTNIDIRRCSPKFSHSQVDDDSTQITDMNFDMFPLQKNEPLHELEKSSSLNKLDEQSFSEQNKCELVILNHQITSSPNQQHTKGLHFVVTNSCRKTNGETSLCLPKLEFEKQTAVESSLHNVNGMTAKKIGCDSDDNSVSPATKESKEKSKCVEHENNYSEDFCAEDNNSETKLRRQSAKNSSQRSVLEVNSFHPVRRSSRISQGNSKPVIKPLSASSINRRNILGETLLHKAVMEDNSCLVNAMIKAGANVNVQDYAGWTPLHEASLSGFYNTTNELLKAGADVNLKGFEQETPIRDAVKEGHYEVWLNAH